MGSKIAARYRASIGEVREDAMIEDGCGILAWLCFAKELDSGDQCEQLLTLRSCVPSLNSINLKINPPYTGYAKDEP